MLALCIDKTHFIQETQCLGQADRHSEQQNQNKNTQGRHNWLKFCKSCLWLKTEREVKKNKRLRPWNFSSYCFVCRMSLSDKCCCVQCSSCEYMSAGLKRGREEARKTQVAQIISFHPYNIPGK